MFSKRSVSVQPSAPPIEYGAVPEAFGVAAAFCSAGQFAGGFTPAALKAATLYQTVDLLAPFQIRPYCLPFTWPSCAQTGAKFAFSVGVRKASGFNDPFFAKSFIRPGCARIAMSGGLPPWTAVASTVGIWSPPDVYFTVKPEFAFSNPARTASNDFCSSPVQTAITEIVVACRAPPAVLTPTSAATVAAKSAAAIRRCLLILLLSCSTLRRFRGPSPDRRSAGLSYRPPPRSRRLP